MTEPVKYRKKPVVVEAMLYHPEQIEAFIAWVGDPAKFDVGDRVLTIHTLEGGMVASPGDYVIRGVAGEHYPCKPDIFHATYEQVSE